MCCRDCSCKRADDEQQPKPPSNDDEMPTGDEFIDRFYTGDLITTDPWWGRA